MKTIAAVGLMILTACVSYQAWSEDEVPPVDPNAPVQLVPAVVYQAPVVYTAPVVYNSPVVYEQPVYYQPPPTVAYPEPPPVMQQVAPGVFQFSDKAVIISAPMYYELPEFAPGYGAQVIYFGGRQGAREGYNFRYRR